VDEEEKELIGSVREQFRWASQFGTALAVEIGLYFPLSDVFPGPVESKMFSVGANIVVAMTAGITAMCLIDAAYLLGYMTYADFRCFFPQHDDREVRLVDYIAGLSLTRRCFRRAWKHGRWWPTVVDGTFIVTRAASRQSSDD
jgi:hypothetical protein